MDGPSHQGTIGAKGESVKGTYLRFYMHEGVKHHHQLQYEWLLKHAQELGVPGGSAFRAIETFGRHGVLRSQHFIELGGEMTVAVEFILEEAMADRLLESLRKEKVNLVYARTPAELGVIGETV